MTTILGDTTVAFGGQPTIAGYIVYSWEPSGGNVSSEDVEDANGAVISRGVFQVQPQISAELGKTTGTFSEFPTGGMCALTGYTNYFVDSCVPVFVKGHTRARIQMTAIFD